MERPRAEADKTIHVCARVGETVDVVDLARAPAHFTVGSDIDIRVAFNRIAPGWHLPAQFAKSLGRPTPRAAALEKTSRS
jgi:hypothetical protein